MTSRERLLAILTGITVTFGALAYFVIFPLLASYDQMNQDAAQMQSKLDEANVILDLQTHIENRWESYQNAGLNSDEELATGRAMGFITNECDAVGINSPRIRYGNARSLARRGEENGFYEITYTLTGSGDLASIQALLWAIDHASFPLRIAKCEIRSNNQRSNELTLTLELSTIFHPASADAAQAQATEENL